MVESGSGTGREAVVVITEPLTRAVVSKWAVVLGRVAELRPERVVADLSQVETIDADGIDLLLQMHQRLIAADARLILRSPTARVRRLFQIARVVGVLFLDKEAPCTPEVAR